jgi:molybdopterin molybdotransferase
MIPVEEALNRVLANLPPRRVEWISLQETQGRVLAGDICAASDLPPFHRSAMDGYAVRSADTARAPVTLTCTGTVQAGGSDPGSISPGETKAIMTGAPVPEGADAVLMVEHTEGPDPEGRVRMLQAVRAGESVAPAGCEARAGDRVLESGRCIGPAETAVLAAFGYASIPVYKLPSVALFSTGDELVEVEDIPRPGQIRNSNAHSLTAQLRQLGLKPDYLGIARDDKEDLLARMNEALRRDFVVLTGGVSMGKFDYVKEVFAELGLEIVFSKIAMKPGKPTVFAKKGEKRVFGLPGNPVSSFVAFENFVRPALGRLCGFEKPDLPRIRGNLTRAVKQAAGRTSFLPARITEPDDGYSVEPLGWKGSADIVGFSRANAMLIMPAECTFLDSGQTIEALLLPDYWARQSSRRRD